MLYTNETCIFRSRLTVVDLNEPIFTVRDTAGNIAVTNGNHRAYKALQKGVVPPMRQIGTIGFDVSQSENFRPVSELVVIDK